MTLLDLSIFQNLEYNPYLVRIPHDIYRQIKEYAILNLNRYKNASRTLRTKLKVVLNIITGKCGEWAYQQLCEYQLQHGVFNSNFGLTYKNVSLLSRTHDFELQNGRLVDVKTVPFSSDFSRGRVYVSDGRYLKTFVLMRYSYNQVDHSYYCEYIGQLNVDSRNSRRLDYLDDYKEHSRFNVLKARLAAMCSREYGTLLNTPIVFDHEDRAYIKMLLFYNRHAFDDNLSTYKYEYMGLTNYYNKLSWDAPTQKRNNMTEKLFFENYYGDFSATPDPRTMADMRGCERMDYVGTTGTTAATNIYTASVVVHNTQNPSPGVYTTTQDWGPNFRRTDN